MAEKPEHEHEHEHEHERGQEFLRRSETKRGENRDRETANAMLRELEAKEGGAPLRTLFESE